MGEAQTVGMNLGIGSIISILLAFIAFGLGSLKSDVSEIRKMMIAHLVDHPGKSP